MPPIRRLARAEESTSVHLLAPNIINPAHFSSMASQNPCCTSPPTPCPASQGDVTFGHDNAEDLANYCRGGYRPTHLGDVLSSKDDKYTIIHKLGFGPSSTVWCVKRESNGSFFALKIHRANVSDRALEKRLLQFMPLRYTSESLAYIEESFYEKSSNGRHWCLVLPLLGPSLFDPRVDSALRFEARQAICHDLASAVHHLQSSHQVCHSSKSLSKTSLAPGAP
jgi:hypothetical protein